MSRRIDDPLTELLESCKTHKGNLDERLIRCALESAYRSGFAACLGRLPKDMDACPIRPPQWPVDADRVAEKVEAFREANKKS